MVVGGSANSEEAGSQVGPIWRYPDLQYPNQKGLAAAHNAGMVQNTYHPSAIRWAPALWAVMQRQSPVELSPGSDASSRPRPNISVVTHELLLSVAVVVVEKWEKVSVWVLAAFAAVAGLAISNYEKVTAIAGERTVRWLLWMLLAAALLHAVQKVAATFVQAMDAGHKASKAMALDPMHPDDLAALMAGMVAAYPRWPARLLKHLFDRMSREGLAPTTKMLMRVAFIATGCAALQLLLGMAAIIGVAMSLY